MKKTISIRDTAVRKERKESFHSAKATTKGFKRRNPSVCFYHGILLGLLSHRGDWALSSNAESGEGYSDILIQIDSVSVGIVIELKYSESRDLEAACQQALRQIEEKNYADQLMEEDMATILKYGIACHRKACMVRMEGPAGLA